jgi:opacity protein-like surface antigen
MNRHSLLALALLGLAAQAPAHAAESSRFHASVLLGASDFDELPVDGGPVLDDLSLDSGSIYGVGGGVSLNDWFRLDAEYLRTSADAEELPALGLTDLDGSVDVQTLMINTIAEASLVDGAIRPYAGIGAGWASVDIERVGNSFLQIDGGEDVFAWQGLIGVAFPIGERLTLALDARYLQIERVSFEIGPDVAIPASGKLESTQVLATLRYGF